MESTNYLVLVLCLFLYVAAQSHNNNRQDDGQSVNSPYPTYDTVPNGLQFSCQSRGPGYYADPDAGCQVWHWCLPSGAKYSFLCPNGTLFNQRVRVCDWWFHVDCPDAPNNYNINDDLYKTPDGKFI